MFNTFTLTILFSLLLKDAITNALSLPALTGIYRVGTIDLELNDYSRTNPFAADLSNPGPRSFMISVYYPSILTYAHPLAPYMTPATAQVWEDKLNLTTGSLSTLTSNSRTNAPMFPTLKSQAIIFSHGYGASRHLYTTFLEDLASHGYIVITIDHPYDSAIVEFPSTGNVILSNPTINITNPSAFAILENLRLDDVKYTLDLLSINITQSIPAASRLLSIEKIGMFGHSFGGATTTLIVYGDDRIKGGLDMDGAAFRDVGNNNLDKPLVLMGTPVHNLTSDPTWGVLWAKLQGWKKALVLADSQHLTYSDIPALFELFNVRDVLPKDVVDAAVGAIGGIRAIAVQREYVRAFFGFLLWGLDDVLFDGPVEEYPEISFQY